MESQDITLIIAAVAAALGSIIYSMKHVKNSNCCGSSCNQETDVEKQLSNLAISTEL